jgi:hypothetical protein
MFKQVKAGENETRRHRNMTEPELLLISLNQTVAHPHFY